MPPLVKRVFIEPDEGSYSSVFAIADEDVEKKNLWYVMDQVPSSARVTVFNY